MSFTPPDCLPGSLLQRPWPIICYLAVLSVWEDVNWQWGASLSPPLLWHQSEPGKVAWSLGTELSRLPGSREKQKAWSSVWRPSLKHTPGLTCLNGKPAQRATQGNWRFSFRNKKENYFQFKSQSDSEKYSCLLLSAVQSSLLADWSSPNVCVCVCVSPGSCLPSVCLPWIGLLSPSQWRATQPGWIFFPSHLLWIYQSQAIQRLLYGAVSSPVTASY